VVILIRNGGDAFIVLCQKHRELIELQLMLEQILARLSALTNIAGAAIKIGASIGLAQAYIEVSLTELVKAADMTMYIPKQLEDTFFAGDKSA
jgi:GGDEF domain-containing protein